MFNASSKTTEQHKPGMTNGIHLPIQLLRSLLVELDKCSAFLPTIQEQSTGPSPRGRDSSTASKSSPDTPTLPSEDFCSLLLIAPTTEAGEIEIIDEDVETLVEHCLRAVGGLNVESRRLVSMQSDLLVQVQRLMAAQRTLVGILEAEKETVDMLLRDNGGDQDEGEGEGEDEDRGRCKEVSRTMMGEEDGEGDGEGEGQVHFDAFDAEHGYP